MIKNSRLCIFIFLCSFSLFIANACGTKQELPELSTIEEDGYMCIIWEDKTYKPFSVVSKSDCGTQIGYINGDQDDRVYEYKDYPCEEWIVNALTVDGGAILFKERNVDKIPDGMKSEYE